VSNPYKISERENERQTLSKERKKLEWIEKGKGMKCQGNENKFISIDISNHESRRDNCPISAIITTPSLIASVECAL
jgi:hypothetical protein